MVPLTRPRLSLKAQPSRWSRPPVPDLFSGQTNTFLGERYRRLVKRRGKLKALVAVARSILVIVWHLLSDPTARFYDLGPEYHTHRINTTRKIQNHISGLTALGFRVTLEPTA